MRHTLIALLATMALTMPSVAQTKGGGPNVGDPPPALSFQKLLQTPDGAVADWAALKGKVVVLEFWATWCGPCIGAIPHLNTLADHFKAQDVQFIAITDEDEKVIVPFLKRKPIHAWVGLNTDRSMFTNYGISVIPHTVIVNRNGKIAAIMHPVSLTDAVISNVLAGKKLEPSRGFSIRAGELPEKSGKTQPSLFQVIIRRAVEEPGGGSGMSSGNGSITLTRSTIFNALSSCYNISSVRIVTNTALPTNAFDFVVKTTSRSDKQARTWLRTAVEQTFGLSAKRQTRNMDVFILTAGKDAAARLAPTVSNGGSSCQSGPGRFQAVNQNMAGLTGTLENKLGKPVFDETGLTNGYDYELTWPEDEKEDPTPDVLVKALHDQLGLELKKARRQVEVVVINKSSKPDD